MKQRVLITLSVLIGAALLMGGALHFTARDVSLSQWHRGADGFMSAVVEQQKTGKPMLLFFYTDWCTSCEQLRNNVLATQEVNQFAGTLVPVQINPEMSAAARAIADDYGVFGYPTIIVVPAAESPPLRIATSHRTTPTSFVESCKGALRRSLCKRLTNPT